MKKQTLFIALLMLLSIASYSQITFQKGYFVNESNQKIECLIKNVGWKNNPRQFEYKITPNAVIKKAGLKNVKAFGIYGVSKYISAFVKIDRSSNNLQSMSSQRNPVFHTEHLFLKVLIEGKASLFLYVDNDLTRYFYKVNDSKIKQLVYKQYMINNSDSNLVGANENYNTAVAANNLFRQQLFLNLKCQTIGLNDVAHLDYAKKDLEQLFIKYNKCAGSGSVSYGSKKKKEDLFHLTLRPGLNGSGLEIHNNQLAFWKTTFDNNFSFRFGIEAEVNLPFNENKWGIIVEPTYQYYKSEKSQSSSYVSGGMVVSKVNYKSIELPIGVRYYFFLNKDSKIFVNVSYVFDFANNSSFKFYRKDGSLVNEIEIKPARNVAFGLGYKYKKRYTIEARYYTNRKILVGNGVWSSQFTNFSIIFGFSIF